MLSADFSGFASTKQPLLTSHDKPSRVVRGRRLTGELEMVAAILKQPVIERHKRFGRRVRGAMGKRGRLRLLSPAAHPTTGPAARAVR